MNIAAAATTYPMVHPLKPVSVGEQFTSLVYGEGVYVQDNSGKMYIDGISGLWNVSLGYKNAALQQAIIDQLDKIAFVNPVDQSNPTTLEFAQRLLDLTPNRLSKLAFTCTGSESVELAIKLIRKMSDLRQRREKKTIIVIDVSYHGSYYGSMSASGIDREISEGYGPKVPDFKFLPAPWLQEKMDELEQCFEQHGDNIAGVIIEPILGSAGVLPIPDAYLRKLRELCDQYQALLAIDEVATGFGRTGKMFAFEHSGVIPDILCLSKGINSGYLPLGAVVFSDEIYQTFARAGTHIEHLSTQNGNPLACAAGIATIAQLTQTDLLSQIRDKGEYLINGLRNRLEHIPTFHEVRGRGLMVGVALTADQRTGELLPAQRLNQMIQRLKQRG